VFSDTRQIENYLRCGVNLNQTDQKVFCREELVLQLIGLLLRPVKNGQEFVSESHLRTAAGNPGKTIEILSGRVAKLIRAGSDFLQNGSDKTLFFLKECREQMQRCQLLMSVIPSQLLRTLDCLLSLDGELIELNGHAWVSRYRVGTGCAHRERRRRCLDGMRRALTEDQEVESETALPFGRQLVR
jgi:hypothetical protein